MAMTNEIQEAFRLAVNFDTLPQRKWPNRTISYQISYLYTADDVIAIKQAIRTLNELSCLKFIENKGQYDDFAYIWPVRYPEGCW